MSGAATTVPFTTAARMAMGFARTVVEDSHPNIMHVGLQWSPTGKHECYVFTSRADGQGWRTLNIYVAADGRTMLETHERDQALPSPCAVQTCSSVPVHDTDVLREQLGWMVAR